MNIIKEWSVSIPTAILTINEILKYFDMIKPFMGDTVAGLSQAILTIALGVLLARKGIQSADELKR